jgi:hypothetical protein
MESSQLYPHKFSTPTFSKEAKAMQWAKAIFSDGLEQLTSTKEIRIEKQTSYFPQKPTQSWS